MVIVKTDPGVSETRLYCMQLLSSTAPAMSEWCVCVHTRVHHVTCFIGSSH